MMPPTKSIPHLLALIETKSYKSNYHSRMNIVKNLVIDSGSSYSHVWQQSSSNRYSYEYNKIFLKRKGLVKCFNIFGHQNLPEESYVIHEQVERQFLKIEDILILEQPTCVSDIAPDKSSLLTLTADKYIKRYNLETGALLQSVYIRCKMYKFISFEWNERGHSITMKTARMPKNNDVVIVIASYSVFPFDFIGLCEIRKSVFGSTVSDAYVQSDLLIVHHRNKVVLHNWESIVRMNLAYPVALGKYSECMGSVPGSYPNGLPCNIVLTEAPPILFECRSDRHHLQIGGRPWHYMVIPPKQKETYSVIPFSTGRVVGSVESTEHNIEPTMVSFHPDESCRILIGSANSLQVHIVKMDVVDPSFEIKFCSEPAVHKKNRELPYRTSSGRVVKKSRYASNDDVYAQSLLAMEYENELDLLFCLFDVGEGCLQINICCNQTGKACKSIALQTIHVEGSLHSLQVDKDVIVHNYKSAFSSKHTCDVYRLSRLQI